MKEIRIGLLGFGTVGAGVVEGLQRNGELIASRTGMDISVGRIADLDLESDRGVTVDPAIMTTDAAAVIEDPNVDVVVELVGGTTIAKDFILKALALKKPVVTANKALLAEHGAEIFAAAAKNGTDVYFEAAVAGGIPIIRSLRKGLVANRIERIHAILNGTCNYILTRMTKEGLPFDQILKEAQEAGYAEADPGLDIDGHDAAHKATLLASLAYGSHIPMDAVQVQGIRGLASEDIEHAAELGYTVKLLAVIGREEDEIEIHVNPTLIPSDHMLASVGDVYNAIFVKGDIVGETLYNGKGAGRLPTASAVIGDLVDASQDLAFGSSGKSFPFPWRTEPLQIRDPGKIEAGFYLRLSLMDEPGSLGQISGILGKNGISIASVLQKDAMVGQCVPVIIVTHRARQAQCQAALDEIDALDIVESKTVCLQIEDFE
jgi:homoserine dehydrogenase